MGDIFSEFFGGGIRTSQKRRGRDISIDIEISFSESIFGVDRKILVKKKILCEECRGDGAKKGTEMKICSVCNGSGKIHESKGQFWNNNSHCCMQ